MRSSVFYHWTCCSVTGLSREAAAHSPLLCVLHAQTWLSRRVSLTLTHQQPPAGYPLGARTRPELCCGGKRKAERPCLSTVGRREPFQMLPRTSRFLTAVCFLRLWSKSMCGSTTERPGMPRREKVSHHQVMKNWANYPLERHLSLGSFSRSCFRHMLNPELRHRGGEQWTGTQGQVGPGATAFAQITNGPQT